MDNCTAQPSLFAATPMHGRRQAAVGARVSATMNNLSTTTCSIDVGQHSIQISCVNAEFVCVSISHSKDMRMLSGTPLKKEDYVWVEKKPFIFIDVAVVV